MKSRTFYQKLPLFIKTYPPFIKNYRWPPETKLKPLISQMIKKSIFGNNRDPCTGSHPGTWWTRLQVNLVLLLYFPLELLLYGSIFFRTLTFTLSYSYIASPRSAQASMSKQFGFTWVPTPSSGAYTLARPKSSSSGQSGNRRRGPALPLVSDLFIE